MVGYPVTPTCSHRVLPSVVQSTSAISEVVEDAKSSIRRSQSGLIFLQCPHHGARNFTKTLLPAVFSSQFSLVSSSARAVLESSATASSAAWRAMATCTRGAQLLML